MNKKAFSLIELSIVILIIGILVAGVTQSSRLIREMRLKTAQNSTTSSAVNSISGILMWLETTSEKSFSASEAEDDLTISTWYDINPQSSQKNNATQTTPAIRPTYIANCINSLPCLRFTKSAGEFLSFDGSILVGTDFSIFIVEQRRSATSDNFFMGGSAHAVNGNLHLGYRIATSIRFGQYGNDFDAAVGTYSSPITKIQNYVYGAASLEGKYHYINGVKSTLVNAGGAVATTGLASYAGAAIGAYLEHRFDGDISEIIIFNRLLKSEERESIEDYLEKKWKIE